MEVYPPQVGSGIALNKFLRNLYVPSFNCYTNVVVWMSSLFSSLLWAGEACWEWKLQSKCSEYSLI